MLPTPSNISLCKDLKQYRAFKEHRRITKGERAINNKARVLVTNTSKHDYHVPYDYHTECNLKESLPTEAGDSDLALAQSLLHSNLAASTRKNMKSIEKTFKALVPERPIFEDPKPGDKDLVFLRLIQKKPHLALQTKLQYIKSFNSLLLDKGINPEPDSPLFQRLKIGLKNKNFNAREKDKAPKRQAHTKETISMVAHALAQMVSVTEHPWDKLRVQAVFTACLIAFWGCARLSDLCGAGSSSYSLRTTLLEKDLRLMTKDNKVTGLELFFGSEKVQQAAGNRVQLPRMSNGPLAKLCPVRAYVAYQRMKMKLRPTAEAPWLIDYNGLPMTQRSLNALIDVAITKVYGDSEHMHFLKKLRGHSFRAALPTHMQTMGETFTSEEKRLMGRWRSESSYQLYCKNKTNSRLSIAKTVAAHLGNL